MTRGLCLLFMPNGFPHPNGGSEQPHGTTPTRMGMRDSPLRGFPALETSPELQWNMTYVLHGCQLRPGG